MSTRKGGLGRGLDSLIPTSLNEPIVTNTGVTIADQGEVDINAIIPNPKQPRTIFDTEALAELSASIKEVGVLQPPVVRDIGGGRYELIMGERRLRASKLAGLKTIPVIIRQTPDNELLREALLENIHRSQLNPLEEGSAYQNLLNDFGYTHDELAIKVGKSRPAITNTPKAGKIRSPRLKELADGMSDRLDTRVSVELGKQKGKITIEFATLEDLERINKLI